MAWWDQNIERAIPMQNIERRQCVVLLAERLAALEPMRAVELARRAREASSAHQLAEVFMDIAPELGLFVALLAPSDIVAANETV